jgi:biotin-[acetyl-CoA-carboxylase] ligase BirA-like protein
MLRKSFLSKFCAVNLCCFSALSSHWYDSSKPSLECVHHSRISSTQDLAEEKMKKNPKGSLSSQTIVRISAGEQTGGKGYDGRVWQSPPGNIYVSFIIPWPRDRENLRIFLPQVTATSIGKILEDFGLTCEFKWINDVLIRGKKICGILCNEVPSDIALHTAVVIGIGLNVNMEESVALDLQKKPESVKDQMGLPFTSMSMVSGKKYDLDKILQDLTANLLYDWKLLIKMENSFETIFFPLVQERLAYKGQKVLYQDSGEGASLETDLTVVKIDSEGCLILKDEKGVLLEPKFNGRIFPHPK